MFAVNACRYRAYELSYEFLYLASQQHSELKVLPGLYRSPLVSIEVDKFFAKNQTVEQQAPGVVEISLLQNKLRIES